VNNMQCRINISLRDDTLERLDQLAFEEHKSRSQTITDLVWKARVQYSQIRGQTNIHDLFNAPKKQKRKKGGPQNDE